MFQKLSNYMSSPYSYVGSLFQSPPPQLPPLKPVKKLTDNKQGTFETTLLEPSYNRVYDSVHK